MKLKYIMILFAATIGIPLASFLYATDFEQFRMAQYLMLVAGGFAAAIDFLFQILTVLRRQAAAMRASVSFWEKVLPKLLCSSRWVWRALRFKSPDSSASVSVA